MIPSCSAREKEKHQCAPWGWYHEADPETAYFDTSCKTCIGDTNSHMPCFSFLLLSVVYFFKMSCYRDCPFLRHLVSPQMPSCLSEKTASWECFRRPHDEANRALAWLLFPRRRSAEANPFPALPGLRARTFAFRPFGLALPRQVHPCHRNRLS